MMLARRGVRSESAVLTALAIDVTMRGERMRRAGVESRLPSLGDLDAAEQTEEQLWDGMVEHRTVVEDWRIDRLERPRTLDLIDPQLVALF